MHRPSPTVIDKCCGKLRLALAMAVSSCFSSFLFFGFYDVIPVIV
jgi:hypothetical protein